MSIARRIMEWFRPKPRTPAEKLSAEGRIRLLDQAANELIPWTESLLISHGSELVKRITAAASRYGVPPGYMWHVWGGPTSNWPRLPGDHREALMFARNLQLASGAYPPFRPQVPMGGDDTGLEMAFLDVANWLVNQLLPKLSRQYISQLERVARKYRALRRADDPDPAEVDIGSQIGGYLEYLTRTRQSLSANDRLLTTFWHIMP